MADPNGYTSNPGVVGFQTNEQYMSGHPMDGYWEPASNIEDWFGHKDTFGHNEALAAWQRESTFNAQQAQIAREWEKMMSDTQFQRKVADYLKAGFSPLAALEGNGSYAVSSAPAAAAHAKGAVNSGNNLGSLFGALLMTVATIATKGAAAAASRAGNAAKAALDTQKLDILHDQVEVQKGWLDLAKNGKRGVSAIAAEQALRKASHGHNSPKLNWDEILDDLEKL